MQSEIPNDVMNAAKKCASEWNLIDAIARAILDERARCKAPFSAAERMKPVLWANPEHMPKGNYLDAACPCQPNEGGSFTLPLYAAPPTPSVAVKPLEWNPYRAETPFGYYDINDQRGVPESELKGRYPFLLTGSRLDYSRHPTLDAAKAAAQADYEARIRAALSAQVQDVAAKSLADAYQKYLDASDLYNERLAISKTKALGTMRVDEEYRAIDEARRAFDKLAVDIAKSALPAAPAKQEGKP